MAKSLLNKLSNVAKSTTLAGAIGLASLLPTQSKAVPADWWTGVSDVIQKAEGESIDYTSSDSSVLPNQLTLIWYVTDPDWGIAKPIGGFDMINGQVTRGYVNGDWNSVNGWGFNQGDTANSGENPGNTYEVVMDAFYDADANGRFDGYEEQISGGDFQVSNFTPYNSQVPGNFTFTYNVVPEPSSLALLAIGGAALASSRRLFNKRTGKK